VVLACTLLAASIAASSAYASAGFGIERYGLTATEENDSADTQAGSHPYELVAEAALEANAQNTSADEAKDLDFELPSGLIINLANVPQNSAIGTAQVSLAGKMTSATVYSLAPAPGELARFGFTLEGASVIADVSIRPGGDDGMTLSIRDLPQLGIESVRLALGGPVGSTFLTLPTSCAGALQTTVQGVSWGEGTTSLSTSFPQLTGCNGLTFQPALNVVPDTTEADEPSGYELDLKLPQSESPTGLASSDLKNATIDLPEGTNISLSAADGLQACSQAQVGLGSSATVTCPNASKVGEVRIQTPLLANPLEGAVFMATPNENPFDSTLAVYVVAEDPVSAVQVKLAGQLEPNPVTGQLTIALRELPQLPISDLELHFFGGARALLANPPACGAATSTSELAPWSGSAPVSASSSFEIDAGANGVSCSNSQPFSPEFRSRSTTNGVGAYDSLTFVVSRSDQEQELGSVAVQTPQAVAAMFSGVPPCEEPRASAGTCPTASEIGNVDLAAGSGPDPYYLSGEIYLAGPYRGASQGLSIVVPFDAGPFELGTVVIRASAQIDPQTGQMTILSDPLPTIVDGIPLRLKELALQLERGEFELNPDGCESPAVTGTIMSSRGSSAAISTEPLGAPSTQCPSHGAAPVSTPEVGGASPNTAAVSLLDTHILTGSDGDAAVELRCAGASTCHGKVILTARSQSQRSGKRRSRHSKATTIATTTFSIPPGKTTAVELRLNRAGRALLSADHGRLSATLTLLKSSPAPAHTYTENVQLLPRKSHDRTKR
jgi:hypothetical protein